MAAGKQGLGRRNVGGRVLGNEYNEVVVWLNRDTRLVMGHDSHEAIEAGP